MNELKADVYKQDTLAGHFFSTPHTTEFRYSADKYEVTASRLAQAKNFSRFWTGTWGASCRNRPLTT